METLKLVVAIIAVIISVFSFVIARRADMRSKKAEQIKNLLGEKESVSFAAIKLLRDQLPQSKKDRKLIISALLQACLMEGSDRARSILYRVLGENIPKYKSEFQNELLAISSSFEKMKKYDFSKEELDLERGHRRIDAIKKILNWQKEV